MVVRSSTPTVLCIDTQKEFNDTLCKEPPSAVHVATIKLREIEVGLPNQELLPGDRTHRMKVVEESHGEEELTLKLESPGGTQVELLLRRNGVSPNAAIRVEGGEVKGDQLIVGFPPGEGYTSQRVVLHW